MSRITIAELKQIVSTELTQLELFIESASLMVDSHLVFTGSQLSHKTLKMIELYLSAHFLKARERQVRQEKIGDSTISFNGSYHQEGLNSTEYGRRALSLDTSGRLYRATGKKAAFNVI